MCRRPLRSIGSALLALAILTATGCGDSSSAEGPSAGGDALAPAGPADEGIEGVVAFRVASADHTEAPVDYELRPSPGGPHHPAWANCGFYDQAVADEHLVHDLEHGAVWLAYAPDLAEADVERLHDLVRANDKTVAAPHPDLPAGVAVVASAWARQLEVTSVDDPRLERFVVRYQDGSQAPESGATCSGSPVGSPIP